MGQHTGIPEKKRHAKLDPEFTQRNIFTLSTASSNSPEGQHGSRPLLGTTHRTVRLVALNNRQAASRGSETPRGE